MPHGAEGTERQPAYVWIPRGLLADPQVTATRLHVYAAARRYADVRGVCWPTAESIAKDVQCGTRAVQYALRWLKKRGWIRTQRVRLHGLEGVYREITFRGPQHDSVTETEAAPTCQINAAPTCAIGNPNPHLGAVYCAPGRRLLRTPVHPEVELLEGELMKREEPPTPEARVSLSPPSPSTSESQPNPEDELRTLLRAAGANVERTIADFRRKGVALELGVEFWRQKLAQGNGNGHREGARQ